MEPKWPQKLMKKSMQFLTRKRLVFGAKMVPKRSQNGDQNPGNSWTFRATLPRRLQGGQMEAKECQNGAKMEPKGSQMERKWSSKRSKMEQKSMKNGGSTGICEDSPGFVGIRWDWRGFAGIRKDSLGFARIRWDSLGFFRIS